MLPRSNTFAGEHMADQNGMLSHASSLPSINLESLEFATSSHLHHRQGYDLPSVMAATSSISPNVPSQSLSIALETQKTAIAKRLSTWYFLKRVHQGNNTLWFNTVCLSKQDIEAHFVDATLRQQRATRFMILGLNLSPVLDISNPSDFLRTLLNLSSEFDQLSDEQFGKSRIVPQKGLFRPGSRSVRARSGALGQISSSDGFGGDDASTLFWPNIPFDLDYFQVLYTLCDMLAEVYSRILAFLGGPSAPLMSTSSSVSSSSKSSLPTSSNPLTQSVILSPNLVDMVAKTDSKLKKISTLLSKEIDLVARSAMKKELASLFDLSEDLAEFGMEDLSNQSY